MGEGGKERERGEDRTEQRRGRGRDFTSHQTPKGATSKEISLALKSNKDWPIYKTWDVRSHFIRDRKQTARFKLVHSSSHISRAERCSLDAV